MTAATLKMRVDDVSSERVSNWCWGQPSTPTFTVRWKTVLKKNTLSPINPKPGPGLITGDTQDRSRMNLAWLVAGAFAFLVLWVLRGLGS